jgi:uncharacterized repeat protein (TIGR01451 family)
MKNLTEAVACHRRFFHASLMSLAVMSLAATTVTAKSLYMIAEIVPMTMPTPINAYDISPAGLLTFQARYAIPFEGGGAVGLAIDSDSQSLFVTYEYTNKIRVIDATTMLERTVTLAQDANDLAGIVYDHDKKLLYAIDRGTSNLYAYRWNADQGVLNIVQGSPFELKNAVGYGIALDEVEDQLYVAGGGKQVRVYTTADWSPVRTITLRRPAISVAVDPKRGFLYTGGGYVWSHFLTQYNLVDGTESEVEVAPDAGVMGLAVDPATGFIYLTTGLENQLGEGGDDRNDLMVYNTALMQVQVLENVSLDPTAVVIPGRQVSYNPLRLVKTIDQPSVTPTLGAIPEVAVGEEVTYEICFDHAEYVLSNITIVDTLPPQVTFVRADGDGAFGQYDPRTHSYTWQDPPLSEGTSTCLRLVATVNADVAAGTPITNSVTIDTAETPPTTTAVDAIATVVVPPFQPLNVTKTIVAGAYASDPTGVVYANAGSRITYQICYSNRANTQPVTNVTVVDTLPGEVTFLDATGRNGQYSAMTHTYTWWLPSLAAGEEGCVELTVQLDSDVAGGTAITNRATMDSDETVATTATAVMVVSYEPLRVTKRIKSGAVEDPNMPGQFLANAGSDLTYEICVANPSTTGTVTHISIVDALPANTSFVSAERDREIGYYDSTSHTYTWFYGSLAPGVEDCLDLVVHILETVEPNTTISNSVTVSARQSQTTTATVVVLVPEKPEPPAPAVVQCDLLLKPMKLYRGLPGQSTSLEAVVHLPQGYGRQMIVQQPLRLMPGNIPSLSQRTFGTNTAGAVMAFFDPQALLSATSANGFVMVTVIGQLTDGRAFQGQQEIEILPPSK